MGALIILIYLIIVIAVFAGFWKVYTKAGKPGWAILIPIYNLIVWLEIVGRPLWWILLILFIPIVGWVMSIIIIVDLVKKFGQPGWHALLFIFFGFIYIPYMGFSKSVTYQG